MIEARRQESWIELALAAPPVVFLAAAAILLMNGAAGRDPFAAPADLTLPEAAAIRDEAEVLRQIGDGVDPDAPALLRRGVLSDPEFLMTPLEAAVAAKHETIVRLLLENGATVGDENWPVLVCLAQRSDQEGIAALLMAYSPDGVPPDCRAVRLPF